MVKMLRPSAFAIKVANGKNIQYPSPFSPAHSEMLRLFFLSKHHGQLDIGKSSYFDFGLVGWGCKNLVNLNIILTFSYLDIKSILL